MNLLLFFLFLFCLYAYLDIDLLSAFCPELLQCFIWIPLHPFFILYSLFTYLGIVIVHCGKINIYINIYTKYLSIELHSSLYPKIMHNEIDY